ncbi:hypothetical protein LX36DRAFT_250151 [Colletotrichum falcatum]|nr:hypothetical protein LX36DRAFT_250151 [Colletotrichum falcatum]
MQRCRSPAANHAPPRRVAAPSRSGGFRIPVSAGEMLGREQKGGARRSPRKSPPLIQPEPARMPPPGPIRRLIKDLVPGYRPKVLRTDREKGKRWARMSPLALIVLDDHPPFARARGLQGASQPPSCSWHPSSSGASIGVFEMWETPVDLRHLQVSRPFALHCPPPKHAFTLTLCSAHVGTADEGVEPRVPCLCGHMSRQGKKNKAWPTLENRQDLP